MERLTENAFGVVNLKCANSRYSFKCGDCEKLDDAVVRLAAYEDIGLMPEYVVDLMGNHAMAICELAMVPKWIPLTEKLPEQGQEVIVYDGGVQKPKVFAYQFWNKEYDSWAHVTHWMPLPQAPSENRPVFEDDTHEHSGLVTED